LANENTNTQRAYRAPCPGCGAPVEFRSAQSTHAVCGYCQSTVVRQGEVLSRIGKMAELFDDHSLLQLHASGVWNGQDFTLLGRLQYKYGEGTWTEWHAVLGDGSSAFLSEDNGAYVFTTAQPVQRDMPAAERFRIGASTAINGKPFTVSSNQQVSLIAAQGELPRLPELGRTFAMVELRSQVGEAGTAGGAGEGEAGGEVLSVDYSTQPPSVSMGRSVRLEDLKLTGLKDSAAKDEKGRQFACPQCGATLSVQLATSKSLTCGSCHSIIDISQGIGGELKHAIQDEPINPLIPLGTVGTLQGAQWQVVGFQHRMGTDPADPDEQFGWEEYLLYNAKRGFTFLVDSTEGWSVVKPATGAPTLSSNQQMATYLGTRYMLKERYRAETNYVVGEFYWQVHRGQTTQNSDYVSGKNLLSLEQTANEQTWSVGSKLDANTVAAAFKLQDKKDLLQRSDVGPLSVSTGNPFMQQGFWWFVVIVLVIFALARCSSDCDPNVENCSSSSYRSSGGSYGGYSSGGGHK
jgi:ribosomal protein S27AE